MAIGVASLVGMLVPRIADIIDSAVEDKDLSKKLKQEINSQLIQDKAKLEQSAAEIVKAEINGESWMQRNWRPVLMFVFMAILANNFILVPYAVAFGLEVPVLEFPQAFWGLLTVGVGGYIGGRSYEKIKSKSTNFPQDPMNGIY